jgi:hypothetical protein
MFKVIACLCHIMVISVLAYSTFKQLSFAYENIKENDKRSVIFNIVCIVILVYVIYYISFVSSDVRVSFKTIIDYFS